MNNNNLKDIDKKPENKALPEVFKELENIRKMQIKEQLEEKNTKKSTKIKNKKSNKKLQNSKTTSKNKPKEKSKTKITKKSNTAQNNVHKQKVSINFKEIITERDPLSIVMLSVVALLGITMFSSNYIFAKEEESYLENNPKNF